MKAYTLLTVVGGLALAGCSGGPKSVETNLSGTWRLEGTDEKGAAIACPIAVPGDVHSALYKAKLIPDPFWGDNEKQTQWVGRHDWTVVRTFVLDDETLARKAAVLRLEDVDLFATVYVNGHEVGRTDDRYCRWEFDVKPYLKSGTNEVKGVFGSSENAVPALEKEYAPRRFNMACAETRWLKSLSLLRKPACHGGWDWGLAQMITGFCGDVKLLCYDDFKIDYITSTQTFDDKFRHCDLSVTVEATDADGRAFAVTNDFAIDNPPLWWPNGAGPQKFYKCKLDVRGRTIRKRIGLRKIEVLNTPDVDADGKPGARMAFRVNGRELFMKGADWIPCSAFDAEQTPARYRDLVRSAAAANMNMLRVWGGGQFEKEAFYNACDEHGILLWHDFMFSCAVYPGDDRFLGKLRGELKHQLRRLRDHASVAMWCGDNECVGALGWWNASKKDAAYHKKAFENRCAVMNECIAKYDPTRQFWPSSPCAGPGNYADNWHDDSFGDMHLWTVWHENKPFSDYYRYHPRFCSEFGFQSFSSPEVAATYATKADVAAHAPAFEWHQKNLGGNDRIRKTMARYFKPPKDAESELLLSQFQQGLAIKTASENWRAQRPRCMGTLFWQLNDNWPVASWSSVEYGGKWKPLQHLARRFFAPVWVVANPDGQVTALNDTAETVKGELTLEYWTYGGQLVSSERKAVSLPPDAATPVATCAPSKGVPVFLVMTLATPQGTVQNDWHFAAYKDVPVVNAKVKASIEAEGRRRRVTLSTDRPAFFVWANVRGVRGEFDDNCLTLLPGRPVTLTFRPKEPVDETTFTRAFSVAHLASVTEVPEPVKVIFDTDMLTDYDDAGALACLHALADAGECEILATVSCTRGNSSVAVCEAVNAWYGRPGIPVGCSKEIGYVGEGPAGADINGHSKFRRIRDTYAKWVRYPDSAAAPDALDVYRRVLEAQPDQSVVICSVGFLTNLRRLVEAEPDLVARKVKRWVAMACKYPKGREYNSENDWESSKIALEKWPTPIVFSDFDYGRWVFAGRRLAETDDSKLDGPVRDVFKWTLPPREKCSEKTYDRPEGHPSWDETAVLCAVRGVSDLFDVEHGTYRMVGEKGENEWVADEKSPNCRLVEKLPKAEVGKLIDELMCRVPDARAR